MSKRARILAYVFLGIFLVVMIALGIPKQRQACLEAN